MSMYRSGSVGRKSGQVKKLVISNFVVPGAAKPADDKWPLLRDAVQAIHQNRPVSTTLNTLFNGVQELCRQQKGAFVYNALKEEIAAHLTREHARLEAARAGPLDAFLVAVEACWAQHSEHMVFLRNLFLWLRSFFLQSSVRSLRDVGLHLFRTLILEKVDMRDKLMSALLHLIQLERRDAVVDRGLLKRSLRMLSEVHMYAATFEPVFLEASRAFYSTEARKNIQELEVYQYLQHVQRRLAQERERLQFYLDDGTNRPLFQVLDSELLSAHVDELAKGLQPLFVDDRVPELAMVHQLFSRVDARDLVMAAFATFIKTKGKELVCNPQQDKVMVAELLKFKERMDKVVAESFRHEDDFAHTLKVAFEAFVNERHNKPAEMIAKYIDAKLRSGYKECTEEELDVLFDRVLVLFRFINGKDVFEAFYKHLLAKRLLLQKSASVDAERSMLSKLKHECGSAFTSKLEGMFKDVNVSQELTQSFRQSMRAREKLGTKVELSVNMLTASNWPTYGTAAVTLPPELTEIQEVFKHFYTAKHANRVINWQNELGHCVVSAQFKSGMKDLSVSLYQALILLLFNTQTILTCAQIQELTRLEPPQLTLTLQSLACGKVRVLAKSPKGRDVNMSDRFAVNEKFSNPHKRIKINQIQLKETKEEQTATQEKVFQDRIYTVDAAIVRFMKTRKKMKHTLLMTELFNSLRFPVKASDLKKRIESLIDREYMQRDAEDATTYLYVA